MRGNRKSWRQVLAVVLGAFPIQACGSGPATTGSCDGGSQVHAFAAFTGLAVNTAASVHVVVPSDFNASQLEVAVNWTPVGSSMLVVAADHACSTEDLRRGACAGPSITDRTGSIVLDRDVLRFASYDVYALNLGPDVVEGTMDISTYNLPDPTFSCDVFPEL